MDENIIKQIKDIQQLLERGAITQQEATALKKQVLGGAHIDSGTTISKRNWAMIAAAALICILAIVIGILLLQPQKAVVVEKNVTITQPATESTGQPATESAPATSHVQATPAHSAAGANYDFYSDGIKMSGTQDVSDDFHISLLQGKGDLTFSVHGDRQFRDVVVSSYDSESGQLILSSSYTNGKPVGDYVGTVSSNGVYSGTFTNVHGRQLKFRVKIEEVY